MSISNFLWDAVSHFQTRLKVAHGGDWFKITSFSIADTHGSRLEAPLPNERGFGAAPAGQHKMKDGLPYVYIRQIPLLFNCTSRRCLELNFLPDVSNALLQHYHSMNFSEGKALLGARLKPRVSHSSVFLSPCSQWHKPLLCHTLHKANKTHFSLIEHPTKKCL